MDVYDNYNLDNDVTENDGIYIPSIEEGLIHIKQRLEYAQLFKKNPTSKLLSIESLNTIRSDEFVQLYEGILNDPNKFEEVLKPIRNSKYRYLVPLKFHIGYGTILIRLPNKNDLRYKRLIDIMEMIYNDSIYTTKFITDDKTEQYVGFVAYIDKPKINPHTVESVVMFRFDNGNMMKDINNLLNELLKTRKKIFWEAVLHPKNKVLPIYNHCINRLLHQGHNATFYEDKKERTVYYSVISKWNKE